ncbi:hypothetical protein ACIBI7_19300 [Nonomuraea fuscirosea]|uniref:hypothetical protein n=1 Tax=Nonomuraea fuscirosea TaxID=1291556 RepID=UPI0037A7F0A2
MTGGSSAHCVPPSGGPVAAGAILSQIIGRRVPHDALRLGGLNPAAGIGLGAFSFWHDYPPALISAFASSAVNSGVSCCVLLCHFSCLPFQEGESGG